MTAARKLADISGGYGEIISTSASTTPLIIKAAAGQSADLMQFRNSSNSIISKIDNTGEFVYPGTILQVVNSSSTTTTAVNTTSYVQVGGSALTVNITPKFNNSKILIMLNLGYYSPAASQGYVSIYRNSTNIVESGYFAYQAGEFNYGAITYMDSPSTTSQITYSVYARGGNTNTWTVNYVDGGGQVRSTITAFEVAQ